MAAANVREEWQVDDFIEVFVQLGGGWCVGGDAIRREYPAAKITACRLRGTL